MEHRYHKAQVMHAKLRGDEHRITEATPTSEKQDQLDTTLDVCAQPFETLVQTVTARGARSLDVPRSLAETVEPELVGNLSRVHRVGEILLVGKDQEERVAQLILVEHALQLLTSLGYTLAIVRVDHENDTLGILEVVPPEGADLVLSSDVPHGEGNVLVLDSLDVEADRGDRGYNLTKLELVQNSSFTSGVETDHENAHLFFAKEAAEELGDRETHCGKT